MIITIESLSSNSRVSNFPGTLAWKILNTSRCLLRYYKYRSSYFHNEILSVSKKVYIHSRFSFPLLHRFSCSIDDTSNRCSIIKRFIGARTIIQTFNGFVTKAGSAGRKVGSSPRRLVFARKTTILYRCITIMRLWLAGGVSGTAICGAELAANGTRDTVAE